MNREEFAHMIHWPKILTAAGIANVIAFLPQMWKVYVSHEVQGVSIGMFSLFIFIQLCFCFEGYLKRSRVQIFSMSVAAIMTSSIIFGTLYYGK